MTKFDCVIIGGGQSGLCSAKHLKDNKYNVIVLEQFNVGSSWRRRPEEMFLFTSRKFSMLPGLALPGNPNGFPSVDEMSDYLMQYAENFKIPVREQSKVVRVEKKSGDFHIELETGEILIARSLINATGSNQVCAVPDIAKNLSEEVKQYKAETRSFSDIAEDSVVLVVGDGASGRQIAGRISSKCKKVAISTGSSRGLPPNKVLGLDIFWWLKKLGILFADKNSIIADILRKRNPVPCQQFNNRNLRKMGVEIKGRTQNCEGRVITFIDGLQMDVDVIIWAIGYIDDTEWLNIENSVVDGQFQEEYGVCPEPGLFIVGRKWLSCRASELVMGAEHDVNLVLPKLFQYLETSN